ncbi:phenylalanine--tRNA ligase subunit beta [Saccharibacillus sp. CPCC 101409]|uniref:phenylalanine--tRNA ligase subunit beta n=1 Tax=Saccharibacillus sp. CPCC 101409 TaxID=3058041 RepID=UPI0026741FF8|nr:phenylalanine--tRNA ligase subunit beta [Saccharibacillus sp. CPCC 101409]MDO3408762.1 phenylalanine--tRNA ligase subunit beta [Saccharibacillus sp. CPCC 101409]
MKVSTQWLSEYVSLDGVSPEELAEKITRSGIEIDGIERRNQGVQGVVVGYVKHKEKHPDADKLNVCTVDAGTGEDLQIVCGAKNVDAGQKVPVAVVGAVLPGDFKIKNAKLRGVASQGMICSAGELGMNDKLLPKDQQEGILVLPENTEIGLPITQVLGLDDAVLDFDLTPNRSDCLSMIGAAYETAAILGRDVKLPSIDLIEAGGSASDSATVSIDNKDLCSHYAIRYISGVKIGPSPQWMQNRLIAAGVRPTNNVVDITNYVMLECGQPLHAFDADKLGRSIGVRSAREGEVLTTLDGQERKLDPSMLLITGEDRPAALAGVMGGLETEVTDSTVNIALESAKFAGSSVRKTSRKLGLRSEASLRFEKEVDPSAVIAALDRAALLLARHANGSIAHGIVQSKSGSSEEKTISLSLPKLNAYLGTEISMLEVKAIFGRLNFKSADGGPGMINVQVPTRRGDITRDVDLIEEAARIHGYDNIPTTVIEGPTTPGAYTKPQAVRRAVRRTLTHGGFHEAITYSFTRPENTQRFTAFSAGGHAVPLAMPMSEDRSVLRTSLLPQLLEAVQYNGNRKNADLALLEIGKVFHASEQKVTAQPVEPTMLGLVLTGSLTDSSVGASARKVDFFDLKGAVESVLDELGLEAEFRADSPDGFHPGRSASLYLTSAPDKRVGVLGQLHPQLQREFDVNDTYAAEICLDELYDTAAPEIEYAELPRYPSAQRDIAVVVDRGVEAGALIGAVRESAGELLRDVRVFDVYTGERVASDKKSVALALTYRNPERTLTDEEVAGFQQNVIAFLEQTFAAELRK